jgi:cytochrome c biogenesis protein CcmG/thiol:disulfide interchange protein DsbE
VKRWLAFSPLLILAALALMFLVFSLKRNPEVTPEAMVGKPVPAMTLASLDDGTPTPLASTLQGPTLVNLFASWCGPCEIEHPVLSALEAEGVRIVGVAYKDEPAKTKAFLARLGDPFAVRLIDQDGRAGVDFGATGVPETYLVGADGRILGKHAGPLTPAIAEELLSKAR